MSDSFKDEHDLVTFTKKVIASMLNRIETAKSTASNDDQRHKLDVFHMIFTHLDIISDAAVAWTMSKKILYSCYKDEDAPPSVQTDVLLEARETAHQSRVTLSSLLSISPDQLVTDIEKETQQITEATTIGALKDIISAIETNDIAVTKNGLNLEEIFQNVENILHPTKASPAAVKPFNKNFCRPNSFNGPHELN